MVSRERSRVAVALVVAILVGPAVAVAWPAGSPTILQDEAPVVEDGCESEGASDAEVNVTDVDSLRVRPDDQELILGLCRDPDSDEFRRTAQNGWNGWRVLWTDETGTRWEVRTWVEEAGSLPAQTQFRQQACVGPPNGSRSDIGSGYAERGPGEPYPDPSREEDAGWLVLRFPSFALSRYRMEEVHALGGTYERTTNLERDCTTGWMTGDRAPDSGHAGPLPVARLDADELNVTLPAGSNRTVQPGDAVDVGIAVANPLEVEVNVTLNASAPAGWTPALEPPTLTLGPGSTGETGVVVDVPADAAPGDHGIDVTLTAAVDPGEPGEPVTIPLRVTVTEEGFLPGPGVVVAAAAVGLAVLVRRIRPS